MLFRSFDEKGDRKNAEMSIFEVKGGKLETIAIIKDGQTIPFAEFIAQASAPAAAPAGAAEPAKAEAGKAEATRLEPQKSEPKKSESKAVEPKKAEPKKEFSEEPKW